MPLRRDKEKESRFGQMDRCTKAGGKTTKQMGREGSFTLTETFTMACGSMIRHTAMESTVTLMEQNTKETGRKISNMDKVWKLGRMVQNMTDSTYMERSTAKDVSHGPMEALTTVNLKKIIFKDTELTTGLTGECLSVHG